MRTAPAAIRETIGSLQLRTWEEAVTVFVERMSQRLKSRGFDITFEAHQAQSGPISKHFGELSFCLVGRTSRGERNFLRRRSETFYCVVPLSHVTNDSFKKACQLSAKFTYQSRLTRRRLRVKVIALTVSTNDIAANAAIKRSPRSVKVKFLTGKEVQVKSAIVDISNLTTWTNDKGLRKEVESL